MGYVEGTSREQTMIVAFDDLVGEESMQGDGSFA